MSEEEAPKPKAPKEIEWQGETRYRVWRNPNGTVRHRQRLCTAKQNTCENWARLHTTKCRVHGGNTPRGRANPNWKHGKFSKVLSTGKLPQYEQYLKQRGTENLEAMAILDVLIAEDLGKLEENRQLWTEAKGFCASAQELFPKGFTIKTEEEFRQWGDDMRVLLVKLQLALNNGETDALARENLRKNLDLQTRIGERDTRMKAISKGMYSTDQVMMMAALTREMILKFIPEERMNEFEIEFAAKMIEQDDQESKAVH